jgi:amidophosphoribosyltransferase
VPPNEIDVVIPIPESSRPSAMQLAQLLGLPYREGFVKNRYVGRTFIMPGQGVRKKSVRQKLNVIESEFKGRNVLLVDDSIVRGTTSREIVQMARDAGARKVYMASAAPPVRFPNVYGIDMPTSSELVAHGRTVDEVRELIGADALIYQDVDGMKKAIGSLNPPSTASMPRASTASTSRATSIRKTSRASTLTDVCDIRALADLAHGGRRAAGGRQLLLHACAAASG